MALGEAVIKFILSGVNFTFSLAGLALIVVGVLYKLDLNSYTEAVPKDYQDIGLAPTLTIAIGSIIFFIAFFGCCGAIKESTCLLTSYSVILLLIFLMQIALGVFAFLEIRNEDEFKTSVERSLNTIFQKYNNNNRSKEIVDLMQSEFQCCGVQGPSYWNNNIPKTCYEDGDVTKKLFTDDCFNTFFSFLLRSARVIGITLLTMSSIEVVGAIFSLCLSSSIKNRERRFRY